MLILQTGNNVIHGTNITEFFLNFFPVALTLLQHSYNEEYVLEHCVQTNNRATESMFIRYLRIILKLQVSDFAS